MKGCFASIFIIFIVSIRPLSGVANYLKDCFSILTFFELFNYEIII